jgi:hypothetical protein
MAKLHIFNCVPDVLSVGLNYETETRTLKGRATDADANVLPRVTLDIADAGTPDRGSFAGAAVNTLSVRFATLGTLAAYDVELEPEARGADIFLYVFANTLVGQTGAGAASGVSISAHELVRKVIQDGSQAPALRFPHPDVDLAEILRTLPLNTGRD